MIWWIIVTVVVADVLLVACIIWFILRVSWGKLERLFPAQAPAADAVSRRFQSFRLNLLNLGFAVHVTVDEGHLHLDAVRILRWLGARPMSIPWEQISIVKRHGSRWTAAKIDSFTLHGPAWCLSLAEPESDTETTARSA
ncbi:MAG: hypothetical protein ACYS0D_07590 [Planctomycetota bacterium]|jgi:hypothetical protein